jgi:predicted site-specific integrase-resolvase
MTYDALANTLGVTRKTIYNWAASGHIPQSAIDKMADLFGVSEEYLRVVEE